MKLAIIGAGGRLGAALVQQYREKYDIAGFNRSQLDLANLDDVRETLETLSFDVLINAAAFTNVDACETERDRAFLLCVEAFRTQPVENVCPWSALGVSAVRASAQSWCNL